MNDADEKRRHAPGDYYVMVGVWVRVPEGKDTNEGQRVNYAARVAIAKGKGHVEGTDYPIIGAARRTWDGEVS